MDKHTSAVGIGKIDLAPAMPPRPKPTLENVQACVLYFGEPGGSEESIWCVLDFMDFDLQRVNGVKTGISLATGAAIEKVHVLTTHNHGADVELDLAVLSSLAGQAALEAKNSACKALVRGVQLAMPPGLNYLRRFYVPELSSTWTCFGGPNMTDRRSTAGCIDHAIEIMEQGKVDYFGWKPSSRPASDFAPGDSNFFMMEFVKADTGEPLGAIGRFAMHATMRSARDASYYSSDYPWWVRKEMEERFGGKAIFFNGPCGNIAPCFPWPDKTTGIEQEYARQLVEAGIAALDNVPFEPLEVRSDSRTVALPARPEVLANRVDLPATKPPMEELLRRKQWLERQALALTMPFLQAKYRNGVEQLDGFIRIELGGLKINDWLLLGFPGETFWETGEAVRQAYPQAKIVTLTEHGRTAMYLAPGEEFRDGGYECFCAVTAPPAEEILRENAQEFAGTFL